MEYSDDKIIGDANGGADTDTEKSVETGTDFVTMPKIVATQKLPEQKYEDGKADGGMLEDLLATVMQTMAFALSFIAIFICVLAVCLPLNSMRVFNGFGMSERAVDFAERYINGELKKYNAAVTDDAGNYKTLSVTPELTNDDFAEALYVCNNLSYKLMNKYYAAGDVESGRYYALRVEKYTRIYLSLREVSALNEKKDSENIYGMPLPALRPMVYSYAHDMRVMNYRARVYLGMTDKMLYNDGRAINQTVVTDLTERMSKFYGTTATDRYVIMGLLDEFTDFAAQLGEYLDVEFIRAGVENDLSKKVDNALIITEDYGRKHLINVIFGNEFSMFVYGKGAITEARRGFTALYTQLKECYTRYSQMAADFRPSDGDAKEEEQLRQLYWLRTLSSTAIRLKYMLMLMYYSSANFGASDDDIRSEYSANKDYFLFVASDSRPNELSAVYANKLVQYLANFQ